MSKTCTDCAIKHHQIREMHRQGERLLAEVKAMREVVEEAKEALRRISINTNDNGSGAAEFASKALASLERTGT